MASTRPTPASCQESRAGRSPDASEASRTAGTPDSATWLPQNSPPIVRSLFRLVNLAAMPDRHHDHDKQAILYPIDDAPVTDSNSPPVFVSREFLDTVRARIRLQLDERQHDPTSSRFVEFPKLLARIVVELDSISLLAHAISSPKSSLYSASTCAKVLRGLSPWAASASSAS